MLLFHPLILNLRYVSVLVIAASRGLFTEAAISSCRECLEGEPSLFCNATSSIVQCSSDDEMCFTKIMSNSGEMTASKGCMDSRMCERLEGSNPIACGLGVVTSSCMWCCQDTLCNYDQFTYLAHLPTTKAPEKRPTSTAVVTLQDTTCRTYNPDICVQLYDTSQQQGLNQTAPNDFLRFCGQIPAFFQCILKNTLSCTEEDYINHTEKDVMPFIRSLDVLCDKDCDTRSSTSCTYDMNTLITQGLFELDMNVFCQVMLRTVRTTLMCVQRTSSTCPDKTIFTVYNVTVTAVNKLIQVICGCRDAPCTTKTPYTTTTPGASYTNPTQSSTAASPQTSSVSHSTMTRKVTSTKMPPPECNIITAKTCVIFFGETVFRTKSEGGDFGYICGKLVPETVDCIRKNTESCPDHIRERAEMQVMYVHHLVMDECQTPTTTQAPLSCDTMAARACVLHLFRLINQTKDLQQACNLIPNTTLCVVEKTASCSELEKQSLNKTLVQVLHKLGKKCDNFFQCPGKDHIRVTEGGRPVHLDFVFGADPKYVCPENNCEVYIQILSEHQGHAERCGNVHPEIVFGHGEDGGTGCRRRITAQNWQDQMQFNVAARIDFKKDGNKRNRVKIVLVMEVDGKAVETRVLCQVTVEVIDSDTGATCKSVGDPHISTFDGLYYNNFLRGIFQLYKHNRLPYEDSEHYSTFSQLRMYSKPLPGTVITLTKDRDFEIFRLPLWDRNKWPQFQVQVVYTQCGHSASCACAAAVRSGDSVFVLDYCRRKSLNWFCQGRHNRRHCNKSLRVKLYKHDDITCGTRIFRRHEHHYSVLLPHGMIVKIVVVDGYLNVYIMASPYDKFNTSGLCGTYDGNRRNDLVLRNKDSYHAKISRLPRQQPTPFCNNWRVPKSENIFMGVKRNLYMPPEYSVCTEDAEKTTANCFSLLETCDLNLGQDITNMLPASLSVSTSKRSKREEDAVVEFDYVLDLDLEPQQTQSGKWTFEKAYAYCSDFIAARPMYGSCKDIVGEVSMNNTLDMCTQDLMETEDEMWVVASVADLLEECAHMLSTKNTNTVQDVDELSMLQEMNLLTCSSGCPPYQYCLDGECQCPENDVCEMPSDHVPKIQLDLDDGLCPQRQTDCTAVIVYGDNFERRGDLVCQATKMEAFEEETDSFQDHTIAVRLDYISVNQIICHLPSSSGSYYISVSNNGLVFSNTSVFYPYDDLCYDCHVSNCNVQCSRKPNTCVIEGMCYIYLEVNVDNVCLYCQPNMSANGWTWHEDLDQCRSTSLLVAIIVSVVVIVLLAVATVVILIICLRRRATGQQQQLTNSGTAESSDNLLSNLQNQTYRTSLHVACKDTTQNL